MSFLSWRSLLGVGSSRTRAIAAVFSTGAMSLSSMLLSVSIARVESVEGFGAYSFAQILFILSSGFIAASVTDTSLVRSHDGALAVGFQRAILLATAIAVCILVGALITGSMYLTILALALPGMIALDYLRTVETSLSSVAAGLGLAFAWAGLSSLFSTAAIFLGFSSLATFAVWAGSASLLGIVGSMALGYPRTPRWQATREENRHALFFAGDYLVGSGGSVVSTAILGPFVGVQVVGAIRGAGTLLGPVNLVATAVRVVLLPHLAASGDSIGLAVSRAKRALLALLAACGPLIGAVLLIPPSIGSMLLGASWPAAAAVLFPLALESFFGLVSNVAAAGHRAAMAARRTLILRVSVGLPRPLLLLGAATLWGASGAAWVMAGVASVNAVAWWVSYVQMAGRAAKGAADG